VSIDHSLWGMFANASILVKAVMVLLLMISLISWTLIFYRGSYLKSRKNEWRKFINQLNKKNDYIEIYQALKKQENHKSIDSIFIAGFDEFIAMKKTGANQEAIMSAVTRAMSIQQAKELDKIEQNISVLATIGSTSPYIGLFGTVWGIMTSFQALGAVQQATISMVAPGISEALIATALGLFAAIPAVVAYNRYVNQIDFLANQYENFKQEFLVVLNRKLQSHEPTWGVDYE